MTRRQRVGVGVAVGGLSCLAIVVGLQVGLLLLTLVALVGDGVAGLLGYAAAYPLTALASCGLTLLVLGALLAADPTRG